MKSALDEATFRRDLSRYLTDMHKASIPLADQMRLNLNESTFSSLLQLIEGCQLVVDCLSKTEELFLEYASEDERKCWDAAERSLQDVVNSLLNAFEKRDFVLAADLVEYELTQTLEIWNEVIEVSGSDNEALQTPVG